MLRPCAVPVPGPAHGSPEWSCALLRDADSQPGRDGHIAESPRASLRWKPGVAWQVRMSVEWEPPGSYGVTTDRCAHNRGHREPYCLWREGQGPQESLVPAPGRDR